MNKMYSNKNNGVHPYTMQKEGITFFAENNSKEIIDTIDRIVRIYPSRKKVIARYMLQNGLTDSYGKMTEVELMDKLGNPTIDLDIQKISYTENIVDTGHILSMEYSGDLEKFYYFSIDG